MAGINPGRLKGQRQDGAPGTSSVNKGGRSGVERPKKGAGRARGINVWYPNKGNASSGDSGESQTEDCEK